MSLFNKIRELLGFATEEENHRYKSQRIRRERQMETQKQLQDLPAYEGGDAPAAEEELKPAVSLEIGEDLQLLLVNGDDIANFYLELRSALEQGVMLHLNFAGATDLATAQKCLTNLHDYAKTLGLKSYRLTSSTFLLGAGPEAVALWSEEKE